MSSVAQRLMTAEEFRQLHDGIQHRELVHGEVIETMPPTPRHGKIAGVMYALLWLWIKGGKGGEGGHASVEGGYILSQSPDTVRAPDVSYVRAEHVPPEDAPDTFWFVAPDLAVEVVSRSETASDVQEKVHDFLSAGTLLVWVVYPRTRTVVAHTPNGTARTYSEDDTLDHPDVLPGFSCKVSELFA